MVVAVSVDSLQIHTIPFQILSTAIWQMLILFFAVIYEGFISQFNENHPLLIYLTVLILLSERVKQREREREKSKLIQRNQLYVIDVIEF